MDGVQVERGRMDDRGKNWTESIMDRVKTDRVENGRPSSRLDEVKVG